MNTPERFFWFAHYGMECPSVRYRARYPLDHMRDRLRMRSSLYIPERSVRGLLRLLVLFVKALVAPAQKSVVVIQKVCSTGFYASVLRLLVRLKPNTIYDIDDAEYLRSDTRTLHFFLKRCALVTVGSEALAEYCRPYNDHVRILTSPVYEHGVAKNGAGSGKLHLGWVGDTGNGAAASDAYSHKRSLYELVFPAVKAYGHEIKLTLLGIKNRSDIPAIAAYFCDSPQVELNIPVDLDWRQDAWLYKKIREFDAGLAPMVDHPFNRAKSAFKAKQYLSVGVPVIGSRMGGNDDFVQHHQNGILCDTVWGFLDAIKAVACMPPEQYARWSRAAMAQRGRFSMDRYAAALLACGSLVSAPLVKVSDRPPARRRLNHHESNHLPV